MAIFTSSWTPGWSGDGSWGGISCAGKGSGAGAASLAAAAAALGYGAWPAWGASGAASGAASAASGGRGTAGGKGDSGKGGAPVNCNVRDLPKTQIDGLPRSGVLVYRGDAERLVDFVEVLRARLDEYGWGECAFENIDVAQVQWPSLAFTLLVDLLQEKGASTKRLKAFKCGLDDDALRAVAQWLEKLPADSMPAEVHLSHNRITQAGFEAVFQVLAAKKAELSTSVPPVWFRVEQSQVPAPYLQELARQGRVQFVQRIGMRKAGDAVIAMPSYCSGPDSKPSQSKGAQQGEQQGAQQFAQQAYKNTGSIGGAAVAAAGVAGAAGSFGSGGSWDSWAATPCGSWGAPPQRSDGWQAEKQTVWTAQAPTASRVIPPAGAARLAPVNRSTWAQGGAAPAGAARLAPVNRAQGGAAQKVGTAGAAQRQDRSRTPGPATKAKAPMEDHHATKLPPGWEEHWSDDYKIPYYWHRETGDSLWEAPK